ncbi:MAG: ATP-binding protein [Bacteroidota bacterium]
MNQLIKTVMEPVSNFWNCLISVGANEQLPENESKYIRFTNVVALLTTFAVVLYIPYTIFSGYYLLSVLQTIDALCVLTVLWLNHKQQHKLARHSYFLVVNFFVLINSCFIGFESKVHDFFYVTYIVPFLLFSVKDYKNIILGVLIAVVSFNLYQHIHPFFTSYNLDMATQLNMYQLNMWMRFVLFGIAIYILAYYNYSSETALAASNRKLKEQATELKRSNEDLEQFAYIISHDLKAPVRNISSFMKLLLSRYSDSFTGDAREFMEHSRTSAERLSAQIDDLLSYCRTGRNLPPPASVDLEQMVKTIRMELSQKITERNVHFTIDQELPVLHQVHSGMIHHVFQNLIENAIKFNTHDKIEIRIGASEEEGQYTFSVSDNGIGIDPVYKSKLFQMFKRLHSADQFEGTGIGLAVCKKIVNFYNGDIWFESEPDNGTTFYFTLPVKENTESSTITTDIPRLTNVLKAA